MVDYPFETPVFPIAQPIGTFYIAVLPAELLLEVAASHVMSATANEDNSGYELHGTQRVIRDKRLTEIADYINRTDSSFPNSIILAANYNRDLGIDQEETEHIAQEDSSQPEQADESTSKAWTVTPDSDGCWRLRIPTAEKLAAIIDGQHRLFAFAKAASKRLDMQLLCAIFLDLPKPIQAQLFATINSTQKPVDRSLTYELFGYNIEDESEALWTPDKLAVFFARKLGTEDGSPLKGKIIVAPKRDEALEAIAAQGAWKVSTAVVVDGILRLFSSNPKRDSNLMRTPEARPRTALKQGPKDKSPLREEFILCNDILIFTVVENYLRACERIFWNAPKAGSYIVKTVGVQALFDILRKLTPGAVAAKNVQVSYFEERLKLAGAIDFAAENFQVPAGSGRSMIRRAIEEKMAS